MTVSRDIREKQFTEILYKISEFGMSWKRALKGMMSSKDFNKLIDNDEEKQKRYARACEQRADFIAEETIEIADCLGEDTITTEDGRVVENQRVINRDRLRVETRKWLLSKLHPKKYGDSSKMDVTTNGKDLISRTIIVQSDQAKNDLNKL